MRERYQVVTNAGYDGGLDEKLEYKYIKDAIKACKEYLADGYEGVAIYDFETKEWKRFYGNFSREMVM